MVATARRRRPKKPRGGPRPRSSVPAATPPPLLGIFGRDRHDFVHGTAAPEGAEGWDLRHARHAAGFDAGRFAALFLARVVPAVAHRHACCSII